MRFPSITCEAWFSRKLWWFSNIDFVVEAQRNSLSCIHSVRPLSLEKDHGKNYLKNSDRKSFISHMCRGRGFFSRICRDWLWIFMEVDLSKIASIIIGYRRSLSYLEPQYYSIWKKCGEGGDKRAPCKISRVNNSDIRKFAFHDNVATKAILYYAEPCFCLNIKFVLYHNHTPYPVECRLATPYTYSLSDLIFKYKANTALTPILLLFKIFALTGRACGNSAFRIRCTETSNSWLWNHKLQWTNAAMLSFIDRVLSLCLGSPASI